ncbi:MAG: protein-glutamate O-methyltransferase CheR [Oscillospiraceae bacterium]|nr:protein-glutamate O-methyltransferase CheR [Oscillospiraceae bacterium]
MSFKPAHPPIGDEEFKALQAYVYENSGILIPPEKAYLFQTRLVPLMLKAGAATFGEFVRHVKGGSDEALKEKVIGALTTNETFWFRDSAPWKVLEDRLLPTYVKELAEGSRAQVRIWFAAASTGQEAYSTVMCVDDHLRRCQVGGVSLSDFRFLATDISGGVLELARKGRYDAISMTRGLDGRYRDKYFTQDASAWEIDARVRDAVRFERFNLLDDYRAFGRFDVIFLRYVLIYFPSALKKEIIDRMHGALARKGVLFTGSYALFDYFDEGMYEEGHCGNLTYYTRKEPG